MAKEENDPATRLDDEKPEWTRAGIHTARPALDMIEEAFGRRWPKDRSVAAIAEKAKKVVLF